MKNKTTYAHVAGKLVRINAPRAKPNKNGEKTWELGIPIASPDSAIKAKKLNRQQILEIGLKRITLDNICVAMEHGRISASSIVAYILGVHLYGNLSEDQQLELTIKVQKIMKDNKLGLCIINNDSSNSE
jgi:hypothetical protein